MKKVFIALTALFITISGIHAQEPQTIKLNAPNKSRGSNVMKALSDRKSVREYDEKEISHQDLSDLLWAAIGINRPDGKRTAPTAVNAQEIDVYVVRKDGVYLYDAKEHALKPIVDGDYRKAVAGKQDFVNAAPLCLVMVANLKTLGDPALEQTRLISGIDAGIVSQNINLFCASVGLCTVPRGSWDFDELKNVLKLSDTQQIMLNNPVGYPKK